MVRYTSEPEWITRARLRNAAQKAADDLTLQLKLKRAEEAMKAEHEAWRVDRFGQHTRKRK